MDKEKEIGDSSETGFMLETLLLLGQEQTKAVFRQKDKRIANGIQQSTTWNVVEG